MKKLQFKDIVFYAAAIIILLGAIYALYNTSQPAEATYLEVRSLFKNEQVSEFVLEGNVLQMKTREGARVVYTIPYIDWFYFDMGDLLNEQMDRGVLTRVNLLVGQQQDWWMMYVPYLVIMVIVLGFWFFIMNRAQGGGGAGGAGGAAKWGKARTRIGSEERKKITFDDVAGAVEEKAELQEIVDFLKAPRKFTELGARIPKGVLMVGPPGTGKTYLARAVAGEAGVQFLSISGSDFVELYVGIGASRVRDLFEQAKKLSPSIVFIDEIDAVGRHRGAGMGGGHDEREQTLNQLLVEMDGFGTNEGIIVMAATNRQDILDPALLRPGRFDRQIYVGLPDVREREAVLKIHARKKPLDADVNLATVAKTCGGFTPADLENLMNESALLAVQRQHKAITMEDIEESMIKVIAGPAKRTRVISDRERRLTAYHEAGHAIMIKHLEHHDPVHQISIIPRGTAGGMTIFLPEEDKHFMSKSEMQDHIVSLLGGRVAEKLVLNDISTGASNDIDRATLIARNMVTRYGMSDTLGPIAYGSDRDEVFLGRDFTTTRAYSDTTATAIDAEIKRFVDEAYKRCEEILKREIKHLHAVAEYLLKYETMDAATFNRYFEDGYLPSIDNVIPQPKMAKEPDTAPVEEVKAQEFVDELFSQNKVEDEEA